MRRVDHRSSIHLLSLLAALSLNGLQTSEMLMGAGREAMHVPTTSLRSIFLIMCMKINALPFSRGVGPVAAMGEASHCMWCFIQDFGGSSIKLGEEERRQL